MCDFQGGICPEKGQHDQIQNGRLAAIIDFNLRNIWKTVKPLLNNKKCGFEFMEGCALKHFSLIKFKMGTSLTLIIMCNRPA